MCACAASRKTEECNCSVRMMVKRWWNKKNTETRAMCIYEYLVNHIFNKYEIILISFLHVMWVFLYIYFGDYDLQFSTINFQFLYILFYYFTFVRRSIAMIIWRISGYDTSSISSEFVIFPLCYIIVERPFQELTKQEINIRTLAWPFQKPPPIRRSERKRILAT